MSPHRVKRKPRCPGCGVLPATCLCASLPRVRLATPIAIVQHARERWKPTNTGRLFARMVEGTLLLQYGLREAAFDPAPLGDPSIEWLLLYPREGAPALDAGRRPPEGRRLGIVLLDGTWQQSSHMSRRLPVVAQLPCVALPAGGTPSFWTIRTQHLAQGRSTFEAALGALSLLEGADAVAPLREAFARVTAALLHLKGKLRSPEVPEEWRVT